MKVEIIKKGIEIVEACLNNCHRLQFQVNVFKPNQDIMDMLLSKDYLELYFYSDEIDCGVLTFHNSEDKYPHNGDIRFACFLSQVPEVLECVRKHKKVKALIKETKKAKKEVKEK